MNTSAKPGKMLTFDCYGASSVGARENQEDAFALATLPEGQNQLLVVADGMGGHVGGEIASHVAVNAFVDCFVHHTKGDPHRRLKIALMMANEALAERIRQEPELDGMGTTLIAACLSDQGLSWASVGDSMLLLVRKGGIRRLNDDHSMAPVIERRFLAGKLSREEADAHPERSDLLSVLMGWHSPDLIDCPEHPLPLVAGDRLIVASDGLQTLEMGEILKIAGDNTKARHCVDHLMQATMDKNLANQDNVSIAAATIGNFSASNT